MICPTTGLFTSSYSESEDLSAAEDAFAVMRPYNRCVAAQNNVMNSHTPSDRSLRHSETGRKKLLNSLNKKLSKVLNSKEDEQKRAATVVRNV